MLIKKFRKQSTAAVDAAAAGAQACPPSDYPSTPSLGLADVCVSAVFLPLLCKESYK